MCHIRNEQFRNNSWVLLHDNAPTHYMLKVKQFLAAKLICMIQQPHTCQIWHQQTSSLPKGKLALKGGISVTLATSNMVSLSYWRRFRFRTSSTHSRTCVNNLNIVWSWGGIYIENLVIKTSEYIHSFFHNTSSLIIYQAQCVQ